MYVGNIPFTATERDLRELFTPFGAVMEVELPLDRDTGNPRGFAFVSMENNGAMVKAIQELNAKEWNGRSLAVNEARPRAERPYAGSDANRGREKRW
jgi:cold-inducible RNA-binding protein